jgi:hypothetical protein
VETAGGPAWVDAKAADDEAAERWSAPPLRRAAAK